MTTLQRKTHPRTLSRFATALITAAVMGASAQAVAQDDDPIKVGILTDTVLIIMYNITSIFAGFEGIELG